MKSNTIDFLNTLSTAPDSQIDKTITSRLKGLTTMEPHLARIELKKILDDCAYGALASDFAMVAMDIVWKDNTFWE